MKQKITYLLIALMSVISIPTFAYDIEVANSDGKTIYYNFYYGNEDVELHVTYRGSLSTDYPDRYTGDLVIPSSVTYEGKTYPVTGIEQEAFHCCTGLTSVKLPEGLSIIYSSAFQSCTGLTAITIPASVINIYASAFAYCYNLALIKVEEGNTTYDSRDNCNAIVWTAVNELVIACKNTIIPNTVTSIGNGAFENCESITSLTIPASVSSIKGWGLSGLDALQDLYCLAEALPKTTSSSFGYTPIGNVTLHVPAASVDAYKAAEPWSGFKSIVALTEEEMSIHTLELTTGDSHYYTLDGRKLQGRPTQKGVYIVNGTKVVVK